jgi:hypothetical protein
MIVSSLFSGPIAASVVYVSFEYECLHKQFVQLKGLSGLDKMDPSACHLPVHLSLVQKSLAKYTTLHLPGQGKRYAFDVHISCNFIRPSVSIVSLTTILMICCA